MTKEEKIEVLVTQPLVKNYYETLQRTISQQFQDSLSKDGFTDEELKDFEAQCKRVREAIAFESYIPLLTECYNEQYNEKEIDFLYELYQNPIWEDMQKKLPEVTQYVMNKSNELTHELLEKARQENENA
jgi:hypothetical protein